MASPFEHLPSFACDELAAFLSPHSREVLGTLISKLCTSNFRIALSKDFAIHLLANQAADKKYFDTQTFRYIRLVINAGISSDILALGKKTRRLELCASFSEASTDALTPFGLALPSVTTLQLQHMCVADSTRLAALVPNVKHLDFVPTVEQRLVDLRGLSKLQSFHAESLWGCFLPRDGQGWRIRLPSSVTDLKLHPSITLVEFDASRVQRLTIMHSAKQREWGQKMRPSAWPRLTNLSTSVDLPGMSFAENGWRLKELRFTSRADTVLCEISQSTLQSLTVFVHELSLCDFLPKFPELETLKVTAFHRHIFVGLNWPLGLRNTLRTLILVLLFPVGIFDSQGLTQLTNLEHFQLQSYVDCAESMAALNIDTLQPLQNLRTLHLRKVDICWQAARFSRLQVLALHDVQGFDWKNQGRFGDLRRLDVSGAPAASTPEFHSQLRRFTRLEHFEVHDATRDERAAFRQVVPPSCCIEFY